MSNKVYIALTIGPIYKTISEAKRTRSVWAASYFFSWFIKRILEEAVNKGFHVFLPDTSLGKSKEKKYIGVNGSYGAGLYADRLYFIKDKKTNKSELQKIVETIIEEVEKLSNEEITKAFLKDYLNIHIIEKQISYNDIKGNDFPLSILNKALDNNELHQNFNFDFKKNELQVYFTNKTNAKVSFLSKDAFGEQNQRKFKSIPEIATKSFSRIPEFKGIYNKAINNDLKSKEDTNFIEELIKAELPILPHHKYFAVIYGDGDNIGKTLTAINEKNLDIKIFSKALFEFGVRAEVTIHTYGGNGIYLGGEDILIFAPVACVSQEKGNSLNTVFDLIKLLDIDFKDTVQKYATENQLSVPTMRYGLKISYYKHPLKETMSDAYKLMEEAKKNGKNAIKIRFQKHSGQYMQGLILKMNGKSTETIYNIIKYYCSKLNIPTFNNQDKNQKDKKVELLSSIIQNFRDENFFLLCSNAVENNTLDSLFSNFFNEDIHAETEIGVFLNHVKLLCESIIKDYAADLPNAKDNIYLTLRFIHFINSEIEN